MNKQLIVSVLATAILSAAGGYWFSNLKSGGQGSASQEQSERKPLYYRSAMNPAVTSPVPAKDSMGMDYVPVYADEGGGNDAKGTVRIDPVTTQDMGVKTVRVKKTNLSSNVQAVGRVTFNEEHMSRLHAKTEGWIQEVLVSKTGAWVNKGDVLLKIYSPQLVTSQQEYVLAVKNLNNIKALKKSKFHELYQNAKEMVFTSRERLRLLDVPEHQIKELEKTLKIKDALHIHSIATGVAIKVDAREGQYVTPKDELYMIADLSNVWVLAEVYENELPWIQQGNEAQLRLSGLPGRVFRGKLVYIYPYAQEKTRTIQVRMEFKNADMALKPEMFANVTIQSTKTIDALVVPSEAIIRTGSREQVFVVREPGKFEPRAVTIGISSEGQTQVLSGLNEGEEVVTSAMFLIDSESKLREASSKMQERKSLEPPPMDPNMKMDSSPSMPEMDHSKMKMDKQGGQP